MVVASLGNRLRRAAPDLSCEDTCPVESHSTPAPCPLDCPSLARWGIRIMSLCIEVEHLKCVRHTPENFILSFNLPRNYEVGSTYPFYRRGD